MRIDDDHMYHGAALIQIAEHPQFTAINSLKTNGTIVPVAYKINDEIAVYLKYASKPTPAYEEYQFTFHKEQIKELTNIFTGTPKTFIALVCVKEREICCMSFERLQSLIKRRQRAHSLPENQYTVLVTAKKGKKFRVYLNAPGQRKTMLGKPLLIARKEFPNMIFG